MLIQLQRCIKTKGFIKRILIQTKLQNTSISHRKLKMKKQQQKNEKDTVIGIHLKINMYICLKRDVFASSLGEDKKTSSV